MRTIYLFIALCRIVKSIIIWVLLSINMSSFLCFAPYTMFTSTPSHHPICGRAPLTPYALLIHLYIFIYNHLNYWFSSADSMRRLCRFHLEHFSSFRQIQSSIDIPSSNEIRKCVYVMRFPMCLNNTSFLISTNVYFVGERMKPVNLF